MDDFQADDFMPDTPSSSTDDKLRNSQGMSNTLRSLGLSFIPNIAADVYDIGKYATGGGQKAFVQGYQNPFRSEEQLGQTRNPQNMRGFAKDVGGEVASIAALHPATGLNITSKAGVLSELANFATRGAARGTALGLSRQGGQPGTYNVGELGLSAGTGAVLEPLAALLFGGMATKGGAAKRATAQAIKATKEGANVTWNDISTEVRDEVSKKLGDTREVKRAVEALLSEKRPASIESLPETLLKNPTELLDWRRQILGRESPGILKWFTGGTIEDKVAGVARSIISKNLHDIAPGTITPDQLFSLYSRGGIVGGDVPTLLLKALGVGLGVSQAPRVVKGLLR